MELRRILVSEDEQQGHRAVQASLQTIPDIEISRVSDSSSALKALSEKHYSVFLLDMMLPGLNAMKLIEVIFKQPGHPAIIAVGGSVSVDQAVHAMRLGATDFLTKPLNVQHLREVVQRVFNTRSVQDELAHLREKMRGQYSFGNIISKNSRMHRIFELINHVAHTNTTILIQGETGTGKEQVAQAIHQGSRGRTGPMIAVNCAALPANLLESELFGHERGSFTSAVNQRVGRFELAHGGTLFLDEVGDIPAPMQAKLLRVLQERRFERVGGGESIEVDVRVIAATNRPLQRLVQEGTFREDLYYRLNVVKMELPPLRERPEDIPLLAAHFAEKYAGPGASPKKIPPQAMEVLLNHSWPGNIRELENVIERANVTSANGTILPHHFPTELLRIEGLRFPLSINLKQSLPKLLRQLQADVEQEYIRKALQHCHGNVSRCAQMCGISRRSLSAKLGAYQINKSIFKDHNSFAFDEVVVEV